MTTKRLIENFFRHEYGKLVAVLTCRMGTAHVGEIEDAVQSALLTALQTWTAGELPDNPSAWLFRVAHNRATDSLRRSQRHRRLLRSHASEIETQFPIKHADAIPSEHEIEDDLLRMLFVCCDEQIPLKSQLVFALRTLCGFSAREVASRLFTSQANVHKRLQRARSALQELAFPSAELAAPQYAARLPAVQNIIYLIFTEGHLSTSSDMAIRRELCDEAIRLSTILAEHPVGNSPETFALLSLMHLHRARMSTRQDAAGGLLLLEEQDRSRWDPADIHAGLKWLALSASGGTFSRYHAEAGVAAEHCRAAVYDETRWNKVAECYGLLESITHSPIHRLNRAVAVAELIGAPAGLEILEDLPPPTWLAGSYQWSAVLADLHRRTGNTIQAERFRELALQSAPNEAIRQLIIRRLDG